MGFLAIVTSFRKVIDEYPAPMEENRFVSGDPKEMIADNDARRIRPGEDSVDFCLLQEQFSKQWWGEARHPYDCPPRL